MTVAPRTLYFLVNPRSGGGKGAALAAALRQVCGAADVHILGAAELRQVVAKAQEPHAAWIACGGDGTASAVAEALAAIGRDTPVGIIPLGTGNDLARSLGWDNITCDTATVTTTVARLRTADQQWLDRWRVRGPQLDQLCLNYCSVGGDAAVALQFHQARLRHPHILRGSVVNKGMYALLGARQRAMPLRHMVYFHDGLVVPTWAHAVVCVNINSYAGGVCLAPAGKRDDGAFEVVALGHGVSLGLVTARLRRPRLLGRVTALRFTLGVPTPMQIDGEPFMAAPGAYQVQHAGRAPVLVAGGSP